MLNPSSNFSFLSPEIAVLAEPCRRAERLAMPDPRAACFCARFALEAAVRWLCQHDRSLRMPYDQALGALIHEPSFQAAAPDAGFEKTRVIQRSGNLIRTSRSRSTCWTPASTCWMR